MKGKYIVIEGTYCSGKKTQADLLEERLNKEGYKVIRFSFPVYDSPTGQIVGGDYLGKEEIGPSKFPETSVNVDPYIACLYYAADRKYNIKKTFKYIEEGYIVILERYISSNMAYQGSKIDDKEERFNMYQWIDKLEYWLLRLPQPDMTIFLKMPYEYSNILRKNKFDPEESEEHLQKSADAYLELSELYNWTRIECIKDEKIRSKEDIAEEIYNRAIEELNRNR